MKLTDEAGGDKGGAVRQDNDFIEEVCRFERWRGWNEAEWLCYRCCWGRSSIRYGVGRRGFSMLALRDEGIVGD